MNSAPTFFRWFVLEKIRRYKRLLDGLQQHPTLQSAVTLLGFGKHLQIDCQALEKRRESFKKTEMVPVPEFQYITNICHS